MNATKLFPSGAWQVSDIIDGQLVTRTYYDFSKREALAQFRAEVAPIDNLIPQWTRLFISLKENIADDYRASDDPDDNTPGMCVTIGFTPGNASWSYQTGDNSFTGGAYGHAHWAVVFLYRRSNSKELAKDVADQIAESL